MHAPPIGKVAISALRPGPLRQKPGARRPTAVIDALGAMRSDARVRRCGRSTPTPAPDRALDAGGQIFIQSAGCAASRLIRWRSRLDSEYMVYEVLCFCGGAGGGVHHSLAVMFRIKLVTSHASVYPLTSALIWGVGCLLPAHHLALGTEKASRAPVERAEGFPWR